MASTVTIQHIVAAPPTELVAWRKISMNGNPVGDSNAASKSPRQINTAMIIPKPKLPLITRVSMIERGTITDAR